MEHCTFTKNTGAALRCFKYPVPPHQWDFKVASCIFYGNVDQNGEPLDLHSTSGVQAKISNSIIGVAKGGFIDEGNNQIGVDPKLGPLADNGGPTKTFALLEGSPAIDAGAASDDQAALKFDQRGAPFTRIVDGTNDGSAVPDIGSYEFQK